MDVFSCLWYLSNITTFEVMSLMRKKKTKLKTLVHPSSFSKTYVNFPRHLKSVKSWNTPYKWRPTLFQSNRKRDHSKAPELSTPITKHKSPKESGQNKNSPECFNVVSFTLSGYDDHVACSPSPKCLNWMRLSEKSFSSLFITFL